MNGHSLRILGVIVGVGAFVAGCFLDPEPGNGQATLNSNVTDVCATDGYEVIIAIDTSTRMGFPSGYLKGGKRLSRFELFLDSFKKTMPHIKKNVDFGLITFPYDDNTGRDGEVRVCGVSCAIGDVLVSPGSPYGWMVSRLEHVVTGGRAPMSEALRKAREWFEANPAEGKARSIVLVTAGDDTCGEDVFVEVTLLALMGIPVHVLSFENADDLALLALLAQRGLPPFVQFEATLHMVRPGESLTILNDALVAYPTDEVCDGNDNDCDGLVDEDLFIPCVSECGSGFAACVDGEYGDCVAAQLNPEVCDGLDNDCDGLTDEDVTQACSTECGTGHRVCEEGAFGACIITVANVELCDGIDNNCDGRVDEGFLVGVACTKGGDGACTTQGVFVCSADGLEVECDADDPHGSGVEVCNGLDDDCDGIVDNGSDLCPPGQICFKGQCVFD